MGNHELYPPLFAALRSEGLSDERLGLYERSLDSGDWRPELGEALLEARGAR